jgi:hypothetical protein
MSGLKCPSQLIISLRCLHCFAFSFAKNPATHQPIVCAGSTQRADEVPPLINASAAGPTHAACGALAGACNCHVLQESHKFDELNGDISAEAPASLSHALRSSNVPEIMIH